MDRREYEIIYISFLPGFSSHLQFKGKENMHGQDEKKFALQNSYQNRVEQELTVITHIRTSLSRQSFTTAANLPVQSGTLRHFQTKTSVMQVARALASAASSSDGSSTMQQNQFTMQTVT
jgi:hypothetical protein